LHPWREGFQRATAFVNASGVAVGAFKEEEGGHQQEVISRSSDIEVKSDAF